MPGKPNRPSEGYLEVALEPADHNGVWWKRLLAAFREILPSKGKVVEDFKKAQDAAISGGIASLERPQKLNDLSESEIERNRADARLKTNQADRERAEAEKTRLMMRIAEEESTAEVNLKNAQAEKLRADTKIALTDAWLRAIDRLEAQGFQVTPIIDPKTNNILISDLRPREAVPKLSVLPAEGEPTIVGLANGSPSPPSGRRYDPKPATIETSDGPKER